MDGRLARVLIAVCAVLCAGSVTVSAATPDPARPLLVADTEHVGTIDLYLFDQPGSQVRFSEQVGPRLVRLGDRTIAANTDATELPRAVVWRCHRRDRHFEAVAVRPDGSRHVARYTVRTPSCADRFALRVARWAPPGALVPLRVVDRWGLGNLSPS